MMVKDVNVKPEERSETTSSSLLERVQAQDQVAWARLVSLYSPLIYHWCQQAGLQQADGHNVGQEVFKAVFRAIKGFHHDQANDTFRGWLRTITANKIRDFRRQQHAATIGAGGSDAQEQLQNLAAEQSGSAPNEPNERLLLLRRAIDLILADCEEQTRQVFFRVVLEGHAVADVARELGITPNAIYIAKSRLLNRLRAEFAHLVEMDALPETVDP